MTYNIKDKINSLDNEINNFKNKNKKNKSASKTPNNSHYVTQISVDLLSGIIVGSIIGYELDKFFNTKPLCFIVFMILGIAGGFWNMLKHLK
jgi:F0F1-type ATP synthase assembly protein I